MSVYMGYRRYTHMEIWVYPIWNLQHQTLVGGFWHFCNPLQGHSWESCLFIVYNSPFTIGLARHPNAKKLS